MSLTFDYLPNEPLGRQYRLVCGRAHLLGAIQTEGYTELDAAKLIKKAQDAAKVKGQSLANRVPRGKSKRQELDSEIVAEFIREKFIPQRQSSVLFTDFFGDFMRWLDRTNRELWSKKRLSRALPDLHASVASHNNVRVIRDLRRRP